MRVTILTAIIGLLIIVSMGAAQARLTFIGSKNCSSELECALQSVVSLLPKWPKGKTNNEEPEGSGIVIGDGTLIATANHVIGPAKNVLVRTIGGEIFASKIVLRDPTTDIALLRMEKSLVPFRYGKAPRLADKACAVGNSFGLDISIACGVVSAIQMSGVGFNPMEDFIQTDAAINPGMSGGALVDGSGKLIGMLSAIFTKKSDSNIGINFAVSSALLDNLVDDYLDDGKIEYPKHGVIIRPVSADTGITGASIVAFKPASAEKAAGLQLGDIILFADGRRIKRAGAYGIALRLAKLKQSIRLKVLRGTEMLEIDVRLNLN